MYNGLILKVVDWGAGLAFLISQYNQDESRSLAIWVVNDLNDPVCVEFANTRKILRNYYNYQLLVKILTKTKR